jgi:hypothetical protein
MCRLFGNSLLRRLRQLVECIVLPLAGAAVAEAEVGVVAALRQHRHRLMHALQAMQRRRLRLAAVVDAAVAGADVVVARLLRRQPALMLVARLRRRVLLVALAGAVVAEGEARQLCQVGSTPFGLPSTGRAIPRLLR